MPQAHLEQSSAFAEAVQSHGQAIGHAVTKILDGEEADLVLGALRSYLGDLRILIERHPGCFGGSRVYARQGQRELLNA